MFPGHAANLGPPFLSSPFAVESSQRGVPVAPPRRPVDVKVHRHVSTLLRRPSGDSRSSCELVRVEAADGGIRVAFADMAAYDEVSVDIDTTTSVLTVTAYSTSACLSACARRSICLPRLASKPELVTAEKIGAFVVVTIPLCTEVAPPCICHQLGDSHLEDEEDKVNPNHLPIKPRLEPPGLARQASTSHLQLENDRRRSRDNDAPRV
jgi:hypothetical protein